MSVSRRLSVECNALVSSLVLTIGAVTLPGANQSTPLAPARPALYTDAQAAAGETLFRRSCASCHGTTLTGGTAPSLAGNAFEASWSDPRVTVADVFFIARTTMPPRASKYHTEWVTKTPELYQPETLLRLRTGADVTTAAYIRARREVAEAPRCRACIQHTGRLGDAHCAYATALAC